MKSMVEKCINRIVIAFILGMCANSPLSVYAAESDIMMIAKANSDIKNMQSALDKFRADTGYWPNRVNGSDSSTNTVKVLFSDGNGVTPIIWPVDDSLLHKLKSLFSRDSAPQSWPVNDSLVYKYMSSYLGVVDGEENSRHYQGWKGPYLKDTTPDPWGNKYLIGSSDFEDSNIPVWIISAGPDGILQTPINSSVCMDGKSLDPRTGLVAVGDDICLKYR